MKRKPKFEIERPAPGIVTYPPAFGIDLHVDDSEGVRLEGEEHGFHVVVVRPDDERWTKRVLDAAEQVATSAMNGSRKCDRHALLCALFLNSSSEYC